MKQQTTLEEVILVDENNNQIGTAEKIYAHRHALLHRAFSILIFNKEGEMLLQKRASTKYHSGGLWTNACCGHTRPDEPLINAAHRRLGEEMGFDCPLEEQFHFIYKVPLDNELSEHEYLTIFVGEYSGSIRPNSEEADGFRWISVQKLKEALESHPEQFTFWFKLIMERFQN